MLEKFYGCVHFKRKITLNLISSQDTTGMLSFIEFNDFIILYN